MNATWRHFIEKDNKIVLYRGDTTQLQVDAIVNAANSSLLGGGGVDGAIHRAGGSEILEACRHIRNTRGECPTGKAVITTAGKLPAKLVNHTVGPVWQGGHSHEPELLANCYKNSLQLAIQHQCKSVAFPNISTGIYGYPKEKAATVAIKTVSDFLSLHPELNFVLYVIFDKDNFALYKKLLNY
ncbi:O-acetyl-ADP-ribose deacetylase [Adhaeribacter aquaticus]|uniref:O-acetyl-ADP-ribose deacetylase n=1 Tax=Adhaeribacter aquaticus TaxID=299567 RepID=UPI00040C7F45|nr:O-acetyl-ADP-ribose deacetylase [Adhaeribacter aquaticus]